MKIARPPRWWAAQAASIPATEIAPAILPERPETPPAPPAPRPQHGAPSGPGKLWAVLALALGALLGYVVYQQVQQSAAQRPTAAATTRTVKVTKGDFIRTLRVSGTIAAKSFAAMVAPQMRGRQGVTGSFNRSLVLMNMAAPGSNVKKGDVVAEFDRQDLAEQIYAVHADRVQAEADLEKRRSELAITVETTRQAMRTAEGEYGKAQLDLKTAEVRSEIEADLFKVAVQETEAAYKELQQEVAMMEKSERAELHGLEIVVEQKKLQEKRAEINASQMSMRTPIGGTVVMMTTFRGGGQFSQVSLGDELRPGTYFMQIVDPSTMVLEASYSQSDSQLLRVGQKAEIRLDGYPGKSWPGQVVSIGASAGGGGASMRGPMTGTGSYVRNVPVVLAIDGQDAAIIPDLSGSADVVIDTKKDVLLVPREAVTEENGKPVVYAAAGQQTRRVPVELGAHNDTQYVVVSGLEAGDSLVVSPPAQPQVAAVN